MDFNTEPDYKKIKKILLDGVVAAGGKLGGALIFKDTPGTPGNRTKLSTPPEPKKRRTAEKNTTNEVSDCDSDEEPVLSKLKKVVRKKRQPINSPERNVSEASNYTAAMKEIRQRMDEKRIGNGKKKTVEPKPSTSKSRGKVPAPLFHQEVVNGCYMDDSSDENISSNVTGRKPRSNRYNLR